MWKPGDIIYRIPGENASEKYLTVAGTLDFLIEVTNFYQRGMLCAQYHKFYPAAQSQTLAGFSIEDPKYSSCFKLLFNCKEVDEEKTLALIRSNDPESQAFGIEILKNKYLK